MLPCYLTCEQCLTKHPHTLRYIPWVYWESWLIGRSKCSSLYMTGAMIHSTCLCHDTAHERYSGLANRSRSTNLVYSSSTVRDRSFTLSDGLRLVLYPYLSLIILVFALDTPWLSVFDNYASSTNTCVTYHLRSCDNTRSTLSCHHHLLDSRTDAHLTKAGFHVQSRYDQSMSASCVKHLAGASL